MARLLQTTKENWSKANAKKREKRRLAKEEAEAKGKEIQALGGNKI